MARFKDICQILRKRVFCAVRAFFIYLQEIDYGIILVHFVLNLMRVVHEGYPVTDGFLLGI